MKRILVLLTTIVVCLPHVAFASNLTEIASLRTKIENVRSSIIVENLNIEKSISHMTSSSSQVLDQIELQKDDISEQVLLEHEIIMRELEILDLEQVMNYEKLLREREYIVDYAKEGDKDKKQEIQDEYDEDIAKLESDFDSDKAELQSQIDGFADRIDSLNIVSLNYKLSQERERHDEKLISISTIERTEEEAFSLLQSDFGILEDEFSKYKSNISEFNSIDTGDLSDDISDSIIDEINQLGESKSDVKDDVVSYYEDQVDYIEDMVDDRNDEASDVSEEIFELNPTSKSREVAEEQQALLINQLNELRDMKTEQDDWSQKWQDDVEILFSEMIEDLSNDLNNQRGTLTDKTNDFYDEIYDLEYDMNELLDDIASSAVFSDVPEGHDFFEAVKYLYDEGITTGRTDELFMPDENVLREEFVTFLMRALYSDEEIDTLANKSEMDATDVPTNSTLYKYISAAYSAGITTGRTEDLFGFGENIRRDEAIVMLVRAYDLSGDISGIVNPFTDVDTLSEEFQNSILLAYKKGVIKGADEFRPSDPISRGESAKILWQVAK